jgi:hypothetical protein
MLPFPRIQEERGSFLFSLQHIKIQKNLLNGIKIFIDDNFTKKSTRLPYLSIVVCYAHV